MAAIDAPTMPMPEVAAVPGLLFRRFRGIDLDIPGMAAANQAARLADGEAQPVDVDDMRSTYAHLERCDPTRDICVVEHEGVIAGYARVDWDDLLTGSRDYWTIVVLRPEIRRPAAIRALHEWTETRRRAIATQHRAAGDPTDRPRHLVAESRDGDRAASDLLRKTGYEPFRRFVSLVRPNLDAIALPPMPVGLDMRPIERDDALLRRIFEAEVDAFRDEFDARDATETDYDRFRSEAGQDLGLWAIGFDGDEVAGGVRASIKLTHDGVREGWLDPVFTRKAWRRRGLARALVGRALVLLREADADRAALGADFHSPNHTVGLYESCGFRIVSSTTAWRKPLLPELDRPEVSR